MKKSDPLIKRKAHNHGFGSDYEPAGKAPPYYAQTSNDNPPEKSG
jgi:hypothetical protein